MFSPAFSLEVKGLPPYETNSSSNFISLYSMALAFDLT